MQTGNANANQWNFNEYKWIMWILHLDGILFYCFSQYETCVSMRTIALCSTLVFINCSQNTVVPRELEQLAVASGLQSCTGLLESP